MKRIAIFAFATLIGISSALAQATQSPPAPNAKAVSPARAAAAQAGKDARQKCRADATAKGLKGAELRASIDACFQTAQPGLAKRDDCRKQGKAQGLKDQALWSFVKQCRAGS
ncbi:MAG: PsiF repeat-containing protein [Rhodoblastus sp.]